MNKKKLAAFLVEANMTAGFEIQDVTALNVEESFMRPGTGEVTYRDNDKRKVCGRNTVITALYDDNNTEQISLSDFREIYNERNVITSPTLFSTNKEGKTIISFPVLDKLKPKRLTILDTQPITYESDITLPLFSVVEDANGVKFSVGYGKTLTLKDSLEEGETIAFGKAKYIGSDTKEISNKKSSTKKKADTLVETTAKRTGESVESLQAKYDILKSIKLSEAAISAIFASYRPGIAVPLPATPYKDYKSSYLGDSVLKSAIVCVASGIPLMLAGEAGTGKTQMAHTISSLLNLMPTVQTADPTSTLENFVGEYKAEPWIPKSDDGHVYTKEELNDILANNPVEASKILAKMHTSELTFRQAPVIKAFASGDMVILNEVNTLPASLSAAFGNNVFDMAGTTIPITFENGLSVTLPNKCHFIGTFNPPDSYRGTNRMNKAFYSRTATIIVDRIDASNYTKENELTERDRKMLAVSPKNFSYDGFYEGIEEIENFGEIPRVQDKLKAVRTSPFANEVSDEALYVMFGAFGSKTQAAKIKAQMKR